jgi:hypothetical protein
MEQVAHDDFLLEFLFEPEDGDMFLRNVGFTGLRGVICQMI